MTRFWNRVGGQTMWRGTQQNNGISQALCPLSVFNLLEVSYPCHKTLWSISVASLIPYNRLCPFRHAKYVNVNLFITIEVAIKQRPLRTQRLRYLLGEYSNNISHSSSLSRAKKSCHIHVISWRRFLIVSDATPETPHRERAHRRFLWRWGRAL